MNWYEKKIKKKKPPNYLSIGHGESGSEYKPNPKDKIFFINSDFEIFSISPTEYETHHTWPLYHKYSNDIIAFGRYDNNKKACSLVLNKQNVSSIFDVNPLQYPSFLDKLRNNLSSILRDAFNCDIIHKYNKNKNKILISQFKTIKGNPITGPTYLNIGHDDNRGDALWFIDINMHIHEIAAVDCYAHDLWPEFKEAENKHEIIASGRYDRKQKVCSTSLEYMAFEIASTNDAIGRLKAEINNILYKHYNCKKIYDYR